MLHDEDRPQPIRTRRIDAADTPNVFSMNYPGNIPRPGRHRGHGHGRGRQARDEVRSCQRRVCPVI